MPSIAQQLRAERRRRARRRRVTVAVLVAVPAAVLGARLVTGASAEAPGSESPTGATTPATMVTTPAAPTPPTAPSTSSTPTTSAMPRSSGSRGLHPGLVDAFERAQAAAAAAGHRLTITSGFRTAGEQAAMLEAEVAERGSLEEALWWVFPPDRSMHVQGLAIDVGDRAAAGWLDDAGTRFGLCRTLDWEWWHFEWRERWEAARDCPAPAQTPEDAPRP